MQEKIARHSRRPRRFRFRYIIFLVIIILVIWEIKRFSDSEQYFKKATKLYSQNRIDEAIDNFEVASELNGWSRKVFLSLANAYNRQGFYIKAYNASKRAVELKPADENALVVFGQSCFNLARNESKRANYAEARKYYLEGIEADKKALAAKYIPDAVYYLTNAYLCLGEYEEGIIFLRDKIPVSEDTQEKIGLLMQAKINSFLGSAKKDIPYAVRKFLPAGFSTATVGHPLFKFSETEAIDFKTGVFYSDMDMDKRNELILIYNITSTDTLQTPVYLSVFKQSSGRWNLWWTTKISDYGVGYFEVSDINADTKPEIVAEALHDEKSGALLNIFEWENASFKTQQIGPTWGTNVVDVDNDGAKEIVILDKRGQEYLSVLYKWNGVKYIKID